MGSSSTTKRLDRDALIAAAMAETGLSDLGNVPFEEALGVLIASWERDAELDEAGVEAANRTVVQTFSKRLQLVSDRTEHPEIAAEQIVAPVSISSGGRCPGPGS